MKVLIWGAGNRGEAYTNLLDDIVGFVDNSESLWGSKIQDKYTVFSPEQLGRLQYDGIVISDAKYYRDVKKQLEPLGLHEKLMRLEDVISIYDLNE